MMDSILYTNLGVGIMVALQSFFLTYLMKHEKRINHIENTLFNDKRNPSGYPITKQLDLLSKDVKEIYRKVIENKEKLIYIEKLINNMK